MICVVVSAELVKRTLLAEEAPAMLAALVCALTSVVVFSTRMPFVAP